MAVIFRNFYSVTHKVVWKFQNFSVTEILREIKVGEFTVYKAAYLHIQRLLILTFMIFAIFEE